MDSQRKSYTAEFKLKVVLESMQRDTTQEAVIKEYGISSSMLHRWKKEFQQYAADSFKDKRDPKQKTIAQGYAPGESPDDLKKIIGNLTVQNAHPKKSLGAVGKWKTVEKVELANQLCRPNGPYPKTQVALALGLARGSLYLPRKQAQKDKKGAVVIEAWHEKDDTMGHRKLGKLMNMGKNRVKRVMKKDDITARRKRQKYVYPGKSKSTVPNLLREPEKIGEQISQLQEKRQTIPGLENVMFSDIFEIQLADHTKVRGCFALWKQTRHILAIAFENHMRAELVVSTINLVSSAIPAAIFHSDQGSQYGAEVTRSVLLQKGFIRSMSRAGTPTDNGYAERFVGQFKLSVAERRHYHTLGEFLQAAEDWVNFYNERRPHEGLGDLSPDQFARENSFPLAEKIRLSTATNRISIQANAALAAASVA